MKTFEEFLNEANQPKPDAVETVRKNLERKHHPHLKLSVSDNPRGIRIHGIHVDSKHQNKGTGSHVMKNLANVADKLKKRTLLSPESEPGQERRLRRFYKRFGFEKDPKSTMNTYVRPSS